MVLSEIKEPLANVEKKGLRHGHLNNIVQHLNCHSAQYDISIRKCLSLIKTARDEQHDIFIYGSGINMELAGHANVDWVKFANIKVIEVGIPTLTAYGNDYEHETELREYLIHRGFGRNNVLVGINLGDTDGGLNEAIKYCASMGGTSILITNNELQICDEAQGVIFITTHDIEVAGDIAQTFTHYIGTNLAQYLNPNFQYEWTHSYKDYSYFLCQALEHRDFSEDRLKLIGNVIHHTLLSGRSMYAFGNGGSASMAAYFVQNVQKAYRDFPAILRHIVNLSFFHHIINDSIKEGTYKKDVYSIILEQLGVMPGDALLGISTSGNSGNIIHPFKNFPQLQKIAVLGFGDGGLLGSLAAIDYPIIVPDAFDHRSYAIAEDGQRIALTAIIKHIKNKLNS